MRFEDLVKGKLIAALWLGTIESTKATMCGPEMLPPFSHDCHTVSVKKNPNHTQQRRKKKKHAHIIVFNDENQQIEATFKLRMSSSFCVFG
jgi:hypothetical protein